MNAWGFKVRVFLAALFSACAGTMPALGCTGGCGSCFSCAGLGGVMAILAAIGAARKKRDPQSAVFKMKGQGEKYGISETSH